MKIFSWNVNGIRAAQKKGFLDFVNKYSPDILCLQETKAELSQLDDGLINILGYNSYFESCKIKKGYSGVAIYSKLIPINQSCSLGSDKIFDVEGRNQIFEFEKFYLLNFYFPNGQMSEERLIYKLKFHDAVYNLAHNEIDLKHPKPNQNTSGFLRVERDWLDKLQKANFVDTFRHLNPREVKYSLWTYMRNARQNNVGWRIDYFWTNKISIVDRAEIHNEVFGSDHCPVSIALKL